MFARITVAQPATDRLDDAITMTQSVFAAAAQQQHGYRGFLLFVDRDAGRLTGISLWESAADRESSTGTSGYYQDGVAAFSQLLTAPPVTTTAELAIFDLPHR